MEKIKVRITGTRPLLLHSAVGADPLHPLTKAHKKITGIRKKTDADYENMAQSEWLMSLYYDEKVGPYLPGVNIEASIIAGAKLNKLGTTIKRGVEVLTDKCKLEYDGPRTPEKLWSKGFYDARTVKVGQVRFVRYRPLFTKWDCECEILFDEEVINRDALYDCIVNAGLYCGVGDYRPKFGRYEVKEIK